jgi:hypothetical protein
MCADENVAQEGPQEEERKQQRAAYQDATEQRETPEDFPEADFRVFVSGLYTQTLMSMGHMENPQTGETQKSLPQARYLVDTLEILRDKTEGNLTAEESQYLGNILYDLQMRYVEAVKEEGAQGGSGEEEEAD